MGRCCFGEQVSAKGIAATNGFFQIECLSLKRRLAGLLWQGRCAVITDGAVQAWLRDQACRREVSLRKEGMGQDAWAAYRTARCWGGGRWHVLGPPSSDSERRRVDALKQVCGESQP